MKKIEDPIQILEMWLENIRKKFNIKNFKDFRNEIIEYLQEGEGDKDTIKILEIVQKYMEK